MSPSLLLDRRALKLIKRVALIFAGVVVFAISAGAVLIGPRNVLGMIRYDQREEGALCAGDVAPDVALVALDGSPGRTLLSFVEQRPLVLIFGSFT